MDSAMSMLDGLRSIQYVISYLLPPPFFWGGGGGRSCGLGSKTNEYIHFCPLQHNILCTFFMASLFSLVFTFIEEIGRFIPFVRLGWLCLKKLFKDGVNVLFFGLMEATRTLLLVHRVLNIIKQYTLEFI